MTTTTDTAATRPIEEKLTVKSARAALRAAQKPSNGIPLYSKYINRPMGRQFAALAAPAGLSPNAISLISASFSFAGIAVIAFAGDSPLIGVLVAALLVLGYGLDAADGQVARLTGRGSSLGEWLDHMIDCAKISSLHAAMVWRVLHDDELDQKWMAVPLIYVIVAAVMFFGMILTDQLRRQAGLVRGVANARPESALRSIAVLPSDYGVMCLGFVMLGANEVFLGWYTALLAANVVLLTAAVARWVRILQSIDRKAS